MSLCEACTITAYCLAAGRTIPQVRSQHWRRQACLETQRETHPKSSKLFTSMGKVRASFNAAYMTERLAAGPVPSMLCTALIIFFSPTLPVDPCGSPIATLCPMPMPARSLFRK